MTKPLIALAALSASAVLALGAPAYASHGGDDDPGHDQGDDHGHHHGHHHAGDDHGHHHGNHSGGGGDRVIKTGSCTDGSTWKLKVKTDDNGLEVEGEVDSDQSGQTWGWQIADNGAVAAKGSATTGGRSGSFSIERRIADKAGTDTVVFTASRSGASCSGTLAF